MEDLDLCIFEKEFLKRNRSISNGFYLPYNPDLNLRARNMRKKPTFYEEFLWIYLFRGIKPRVARQKIIVNYIVDFYCSKRRLIIEVDGKIHESHKIYDQNRDNFFRSIGIKTVRIRNEEILQAPHKVITYLQELIIHPNSLDIHIPKVPF